MYQTIKKRDGRKVKFDASKITFSGKCRGYIFK